VRGARCRVAGGTAAAQKQWNVLKCCVYTEERLQLRGNWTEKRNQIDTMIFVVGRIGEKGVKSVIYDTLSETVPGVKCREPGEQRETIKT